MGSRLEANSSAVRKRIENHKFEDEEGEEYEPSRFGGFNDYYRRKKIKLQNLDAERRSSSLGNPPIFRGVVAHVNGYTQPSLNDLHSLIVSYGGGFMQYLDGKTTVTHIIASNLTPKKKVEFQRYRVVKPAWVVESIEAGKLLPWDAYRVVDEGIGQRVLGFDNGSVVSQVNNQSRGYKNQTETNWYTEQVKDVASELSSRGPEFTYSSTQVSPGNGIDNRSEDKFFNKSPSARDHTSHIAHLDMEEISNGSGDDRVDDLGEQTREESEAQTCRSPREGSGQILPTLFESRLTTKNTETEWNDSADACRKKIGYGDIDPSGYVRHDSSGAQGLPMNTDNDFQNPALGERYFHEGSGSDRGLSPPMPDGRKSSMTAALTAEEHNATLLADPRVWKSTVVNPAFLKQYYEESRLHHLSAWKAELKSQLQSLAIENSASQNLQDKRSSGSRRYIVHVDFDSFFAAVSLRKFPQYTDKPVVVAHGGGSGSEIASCNYAARQFGVRNGMWMKHAQKMCPDLRVLPYAFKEYEDVSRKFYAAVMDTGGIVQSVSVDEALVDVSAECNAAGGHGGKGIHEGSIWREQAKADEIASKLRDKIKQQTGCAVSVGIGGNILLAKVALRKAKPAGQYHVKPDQALEFLGHLTVQELPGVAHSIGGKLEEIGVKYVKDVRELSKERMISVLGPKTGEKIWDYSRGIDRVEVGDQVIRKSVSAEVNWGIRFVTQEQVDEFVQSLCEELQKRLINEKVRGRQLLVKIMRRAPDAPLDPPKHLGHGKCDTFNKSTVLGVATNDKDTLGREAISMLRGFGFPPGELRGLGVQMTKLEPLKGENPQDSSQKRLQFTTFHTPKRPFARNDTTGDDIESPQKPIVSPSPHPAAVFAKDTSPNGKRRTPLNTLGTQFVLPTQVDQEVLGELSTDIRSKLFSAEDKAKPDKPREATPTARSRSSTPGLPADAIPSHSQLDPETLDALPADVRTEILSHYAKAPHQARNQAILPQSPRSSRTIKLPKKLTTPTKKRTGLLSSGGHKQSGSALSTLTQSNFVANARAVASSSEVTGEDAPADVSDDFLSALPEDIRREVLSQARRDRLQKKGGIDFNSKKNRPPNNAHAPLPPGQSTIVLAPRPPKPTFTSQRFSSLPDLRSAMNAWFEEFQEEGPYAEDVGALVKYLGRVVREEGDMAKAVSVVKWVGWMVDEGDGRGVWREALQKVQAGVQDAVKERGLGTVVF